MSSGAGRAAAVEQAESVFKSFMVPVAPKVAASSAAGLVAAHFTPQMPGQPFAVQKAALVVAHLPRPPACLRYAPRLRLSAAMRAP